MKKKRNQKEFRARLPGTLLWNSLLWKGLHKQDQKYSNIKGCFTTEGQKFHPYTRSYRQLLLSGRRRIFFPQDELYDWFLRQHGQLWNHIHNHGKWIHHDTLIYISAHTNAANTIKWKISYQFISQGRFERGREKDSENG